MWEVRDVASIGEMIRDEISGAAFRRLLGTSGAVEVAELAGDLARPVEEVAAAVEDMSRQGRVRLDGPGRVVGAAGLSIGPDRHRIEIDGRTFWTWCAYDVLGIFGALRAGGRAYATSPSSGASIEVHFEGGRPLTSAVALFRPDESYLGCCDNVYEEWCPNSNFFDDAEAARAWSNGRGMAGRVLGLDEATEAAARNWEPLARGLRVQ